MMFEIMGNEITQADMERKEENWKAVLVIFHNKRADEVRKAHEGDTYSARWSEKNYKFWEGMGLRKPKEVSKEVQEIESDSRLNEAKYWER